MKTRVLIFPAVAAAALAMPAFAQVAAHGQVGLNGRVGVATPPAVVGAGPGMAPTTTAAVDADARKAGGPAKATAGVGIPAAEKSGDGTVAAGVGLPADAGNAAVSAGATVGTTTGAPVVTDATAGATVGVGNDGAAVHSNTGVNSQKAVNASTHATDVVAGNAGTAASSAITADLTADALAGTGQAMSEEEAKQIRMDAAAARKAKRDARRKHK